MGINREYLFFAPRDLPADAPLLVVLHGYTSTAKNIMNYSEMNELALENKFAVVYPQGTKDDSSKTFWNVGYEFHAGSTINDVDFIVQLIGFLQKKYNLSLKNTFVTGMSNGGDMSYLLACRHPEIFAAAAPVAGTMMASYFDCCNPKNPLPLLAVAGTTDPITSFYGDMKNEEGWGAYQSIPFIIGYWAGVINYTSLQTDTLPDINLADRSRVVRYKYLKDETSKEVRFFKVLNGGHDWPGAWGNQDMDTTKEIWKFFEQYLHQ